ncbi:hypothetical protein TNCV_478501 [Trichonephila clavipes]|nr:hypothetical protein TNCV_478501 [Trichonephila clavipes]
MTNLSDQSFPSTNLDRVDGEMVPSGRGYHNLSSDGLNRNNFDQEITTIITRGRVTFTPPSPLIGGCNTFAPGSPHLSPTPSVRKNNWSARLIPTTKRHRAHHLEAVICLVTFPPKVRKRERCGDIKDILQDSSHMLCLKHKGRTAGFFFGDNVPSGQFDPPYINLDTYSWGEFCY